MSTSATPTSKEPKLEFYSGKNEITVENWISLFEIILTTLSLTTDQDKVTRLMSYLTGDALSFYARSVAPDLTTITWVDCRRKLITRFGLCEVSPLVAANQKRLTRQDTIKTYFDSKMSLLERTSLTPQLITDSLTEGLPESYRNLLLASEITTPEEWLRVCRRIETNMSTRTTTRPFTYNRPSTPHNTNKSITPNPKFARTLNASDSRPPQCRICQRLNKTEYHWHSECPNKPSNYGQNNSQSRGRNIRGHNQNHQRNNTQPRTNQNTQSDETLTADSSPQPAVNLN